jgi:uncharacterized membrane protein
VHFGGLERKFVMAGSDNDLVIAIFENEPAADRAAESLMGWDKASDEIKLGAVGVLAKDEQGNIKTDKVGPRAGKKGAGIGLVLGIVAAIPTGGLSLVGGALTGAVGGGIVGSLFRKGLDMNDADAARISAELDGGRAAVGVLAKPDESAEVTAKLKELGGVAEVHAVTDEALAAAAPAETTAPASATETQTSSTTAQMGGVDSSETGSSSPG